MTHSVLCFIASDDDDDDAADAIILNGKEKALRKSCKEKSGMLNACTVGGELVGN